MKMEIEKEWFGKTGYFQTIDFPTKSSMHFGQWKQNSNCGCIFEPKEYSVSEEIFAVSRNWTILPKYYERKNV